MVQRILRHAEIFQLKNGVRIGCFLCLLLMPGWAATKRHKVTPEAHPPDLLLEGGRRLSFERSFSSERETRGKQGIWSKLLNGIAGEPDYKEMVRPYGIAVDSRGRVIVTDPGLGGVHIFDSAQHKYKFIERSDKTRDNMFEPQCVAVDAQDNLYVTDSRSGKIFVFDANGKYQGALGSLKGGEGYFKRPTGIAIDDETQHIYVTDTLRDRVYVLDKSGQVLRTIGKHGSGDGEFNFPTELRFRNGVLAVVDAMNFRVQIFDAHDQLVGKMGGWAIPWARSIGRRASRSIPRITSTWSKGFGGSCRFSIVKDNCFTPSASGERGWETFNCRPDFSSIATTPCTSWIPTTGAFRYFNITG